MDKDLIKKKLNQACRRVLDDFLKEIGTLARESVEDSLRGKSDKFGNRVWKVLNDQTHWKEECPFIFNDGTKFFYRKGETCVHIVEEKPCVRKLRFSDNKEGLDSFRVSLSLPFVVFAAVYKRGVFESLYCFFSNKRLRNINDEVFLPALPNTQVGDGKVCMGKSFNCGGFELFDFNTVTEEAISSFWSYTFTTDWEVNMKDSQRRNPMIATLDDWQVNSSRDPTFILDSKWTKSTFESFSKFIIRTFITDAAVTTLNKEIFNDLSASLLDTIQSKFIESISDAKIENIAKLQTDKILSEVF